LTSQLDHDADVTPPPGRLEVADAVRVLQGVPLFADLRSDELEHLVQAMQTIEVSRGDVLWRQGEKADGLHVIVEGAVRVTLAQPGGAAIELATLSAGDVLGEVPLLDGGMRSASARIAEPGRLLFLSRTEFSALTARRHPTAFAVKRRICTLACGRLRRSYAALADSLGPGRPPGVTGALTELSSGDLGTVRPPTSEYLRQLSFFRAFTEREIDELLARSQVAFVPPGQVLVREDDPPHACLITLNGAVEEAIQRGERKIPVGLAGPGRAFAYLGLIDGHADPLTSVTRERSLLLVLPGALFDEYFHGTTSTSYALFGGIEHDLMTALRRNDLGFVRAVRQRPPSGGGAETDTPLPVRDALPRDP
jgi:CRP-like cAMP-binding protein